jgi:hypothetical protein
MDIKLDLSNLPQLIQAAEILGGLVKATLAAFRRENPDLTNITDAQIIDRVVNKASTGVDHFDAQIDRLLALKAAQG